MPYIKNYERPQYDYLVQDIINRLTRSGSCEPNVGHVNYVFSSVIWELFVRNPRYEVANALVGVLECVKAEFQRRMVAPYEDKKIAENGDLTATQERATVGQ